MKNLEEIWEAIRSARNIQDWQDSSFSWDKAYLSAVFSKAAYLHIPEFESDNINRAYLIPCSTYRKVIQKGLVQDYRFSENKSDLPVLTYSSSLFVSVIIEVDQIVFVSLRGTQKLYDWFVNVQVSKIKWLPSGCFGGDYLFHRGFYKAIVKEMKHLGDEISKRFGENRNIYSTGHSLGGALAAILNATAGARKFLKHPCHPWPRYNNFQHDILGCYTFGMPRYGNFNTVIGLPGPYHIYNKHDIVSAVPPKFMGYDDCLEEYCISGVGQVKKPVVKGNSFGSFIYKLFSKKIIQDHDIELYVNRVHAFSHI